MSQLIFLYLSFRGRISRKSWWTGYLTILAISAAIGWWAFPPLSDLEAMQSYQPPVWLRVSQFVILVPTLALTVKRLSDRDQPYWLGYLWGALAVSWFVLQDLGLVSEPLELTTAEWVFLLTTCLFGLWLLIDNAFLKGTPGPNRYGPDPLGPPSQPPAGAPPGPGARPARRTGGAWARDAVVGIVALSMGLSQTVPSLSLKGPGHWAVDQAKSIAMGPTEDELRANAPAWEAFNAGKQAVKQGHLEDAVKQYTRAIELYGSGTQEAGVVLMWRGHAHRSLKQPAKALKDYSDAIALQPTYGHRYSYRARANAALGRYDDALKDYDQAIGHVTESPYDHVRRGNVLRKIGRTEEALRAYDEAIRIANRKYNQMHRLNMLVRFMDPNETDIDMARWRSSRDKQIAWAQRRRGSLLRDLGRFDEAKAAYDKAIARSPDSALLYANRGRMFEKQARLDAARADYARGLQLAPNDAWLRRAAARLAKPDAAIDARITSGILWQNLGQYEKALAAYNKALGMQPDSARALLQRAWLYHVQDKLEAALADYTRSIELDPDNADAFVYRGKALEELDRHEEALADYEHAFRLTPGHWRAYLWRAWLHQKQKQLEEAVADYSRAIEGNRHYADAYLFRGNALRDLQRFEQALADYEIARQLSPDYAQLYRERGFLYHKRGQLEAARADYERSLELAPDDAWLRRVLKRDR